MCDDAETREKPDAETRRPIRAGSGDAATEPAAKASEAAFQSEQARLWALVDLILREYRTIMEIEMEIEIVIATANQVILEAMAIVQPPVPADGPAVSASPPPEQEASHG